MNTRNAEAQRPHAPSAGAVLLWCVLAAALVAALLLLEAPGGRGLEFWNPTGALRLLTDLILFHCIFLLPVLARRKVTSVPGRLQPGAVVLFTGIVGLVMLNSLVGLGAAEVVQLALFVVMVSAGAAFWALVLEGRPALYGSVAAMVAVAPPMVAFFVDELFRIEARWLAAVSPFAAWRVLLEADGTAAGAWVVFGVVFASGLAALLVQVRRRRT